MKRIMFSTSLIIIMFLTLIIFINQIEEESGREVRETEELPESQETETRWTSDSNENRNPMRRNTYDEGQCTHYVFEKVKEDGNMIERSWRDAEYWAERAENDDYTVSDSPEEGTILQTEQGTIGHVAYVEYINSDGSIEVSEMNLYDSYEITERTIGNDEINNYSYIHPKENPHDETDTG